MIYVLEDGDYFKVGYSDDNWHRRKSAYSTHSANWKLLFMFKGDKEVEKAIHKEFEQYSYRGEWFVKFKNWGDAVRKFATEEGVTYEAEGWGIDGALTARSETLYIDKKMLGVLMEGTSASDCYKLLSLGTCLQTELNILYNHKTPFTLKTLCKKLGFNQDNAVRFIKRMTEFGVLRRITLEELGHKGEVFIINPKFIRVLDWYNLDFVNKYFPTPSK